MSQTAQPRPAVQAALDTDTPLLDKAVAETAKRLDAVEDMYRREMSVDGLRALHRALITGAAIERMEKLLPNEIMQRFMRLMNTSMGFKTDRGPHAKTEPYSVEVVRRVLIEALLKGFMPFNDEFQIIAGNFFGGQRGWKRLFEELPGVTEPEMVPGIPRVVDGQMCCRVACRWKYRGVAQELRGTDGTPGRVFPIQVNSHSNADNSTGKAVRKAYKAAWEQVTGQKIEGDDEPAEMLGRQPDVAPPQSAAARVAEKLNGSAKDMAPTPTETKPQEPPPVIFPATGDVSKPVVPPTQGAAALDEGEISPQQDSLEAIFDRFKERIAAAKLHSDLEKLREEIDLLHEESKLPTGRAIELQGMCEGRKMALKNGKTGKGKS